ncbi:HXXEE domain-containing protein [Clostridioides difficile]|nr:HXXEE domain-containing protein [Clostridioides difficile]
MSDINVIVWSLPILFMLHDFEEIIFVGHWKKKFKSLLEIPNMKKKPYGHFIDTASFSMTIGILFLIQVLITFFSILFQSYCVWYGVFFAFTAHFILVHIPFTIIFKHFVPGIFTSLIILPICFFILYKSATILSYSFQMYVISCVLSCVAVGILFISVDFLMKVFYKWLNNYALSNTMR